MQKAGVFKASAERMKRVRPTIDNESHVAVLAALGSLDERGALGRSREKHCAFGHLLVVRRLEFVRQFSPIWQVDFAVLEAQEQLTEMKT